MSKISYYFLMILISALFAFTSFNVPVFTLYSDYIEVVDNKSFVDNDIYYRNENFTPISLKTPSGTKTVTTYEQIYGLSNDGQKYITFPQDEEGYYNLLVLPISFKDSVKDNLENRRIHIHNSFFGNKEKNMTYSVSEYYNISSYGNVKIRGEVAPYFELDYTSSEIKNMASKVNVSNYITSLAVEHFASSGFDLTKFDRNNDEYIDGLFVIYDYEYSSNNDDLYWAFVNRANTNYNANIVINGQAQTKRINGVKPYFNHYGWASYYFMHKSDYSRVDSHVYIHEVGHLFGLDDYYSSNTYQPLGYLDMMDFNIGDHNAFSKYLLNWTSPYVVKEEGEITINSFAKSGEFILIPSSSYNDNPFGEYLLLEFYTPEGVNAKDVSFEFAYSDKNNNQHVGKLFNNYGIKLYHVNARLAYYEKKNTDSSRIGYIDDTNIDNLLDGKNSWCARIDTNNDKSDKPLIKLIEKGETNYLKNGYSANNDSLFKQGDKFKIDNFVNYSFYNSDSKINFGFEVINISPTSATIRFNKI